VRECIARRGSARYRCVHARICEGAATLFERSRDGITATKAAEDLLPVAEEIEQVMMRFTNAAEGLEREVTGLVRMTCPPDVAEVVVAPLLRDLLAAHPGLRVELEPGEAVLDLTRREADIALRTVRPTRGDLVVTRLAQVPSAKPRIPRPPYGQPPHDGGGFNLD
jgi:DNA-binding transcriptional LysR family regulator